MAKQYANQDVLCETEWVANNLNNPNLKILEVDYDVENAYKEGHIPGAHMIWWKKDINDIETRDIINKNQFENLMSRLGVLQKQNYYYMVILIIGLLHLHFGYSNIM